jgi:hypothetical protein
MVAGAAFAADASAKVKIDGSLFNYANDGTISGLKINHQQESWNPILDFKFSGEKAGTEIKFYNFSGTWDGNGYTSTQAASTIHDVAWSTWFKPFDIAKVTVGEWSTNLNQETIDWSNTDSGCDDYGYAAGISSNGFSFDVGLLGGQGKYWFAKADGSDATIGTTYFKVAYGADFGTVNAMFDYKGKDDMKFGAGYNGKAGPVSFFVNALGYYTTKFTKVRVEPFVAYSNGALSLKLFAPVTYDLTASSNATSVFTTFKATYSIGSVTPFFYFKSANLLAGDKIALEFKPGIDGSVGEMGYEVALDVNVASGKTTVDVPVWFSVAF